MQVEITTTPAAASMSAVEAHYSYAAQQMSRACGIPLHEAEDWIATAVRRARGIAE